MAEGNLQPVGPWLRSSLPLDMPLYDEFHEFDVDAVGSFQQSYSSPALADKYDLETTMTRLALNSTNVGTVSPENLVVREPMFSTPNSTALTNLTSTSMYNESPSYEDYKVSPMFGGGADINNGYEWFPLFLITADPSATAPPVEELPLLLLEELEVADTLRN